MAKATAADITGLGFIKEMYGNLTPTEDAFETFIEGVISEQSEMLSGRVGSEVYASTTAPTSTYVKRAEKCLTAAEMVQRRINVILGNAISAGQPIDISHEGAQKKAYLDEAEKWISRVSSEDYAGGVLETSHFAEDNSDLADVLEDQL
jgi:hypothetical protein